MEDIFAKRPAKQHVQLQPNPAHILPLQRTCFPPLQRAAHISQQAWIVCKHRHDARAPVHARGWQVCEIAVYLAEYVQKMFMCSTSAPSVVFLHFGELHHVNV
jgi:hypothetical protein